ncbi:josephin-2-like [Panonychus citri]|uniref:josephin-2-like n=1 Tax=Panonychus citri TaxID=50023 RepID=UPI0023073050|nr:josephin-2-like [Panonychus citri]
MVTIYHEKQRKQLCALHSINNLLQGNYFNQQDLDSICLRLSPERQILNPHRSLFGLGNYDVNVLITALQSKGFETIWFDQRKDPDCLQFNHILGFILNVDNSKVDNSSLYNWINPVNFFTSRKHWIAFRKIDDQYYNLDSKLDNPEIVGQEDDMIKLLKKMLAQGDCQLLVVQKKSDQLMSDL